MVSNFWQQQTNQPLFPNMLWSRPETKQGAGKLLIIGGQAQEFIHVAECFAAAQEAGAGTIRVLMPDSTRRLTNMLPGIEYAPSNTSGSFAKSALAELLDASQWSDGVLLAGDLGKNSETNLMLENFITNFNGTLIITSAAVTSITMPTIDLFQREPTVLVLTFDELQKYGIQLKIEKPITTTLTTPGIAEILHTITSKYPIALCITMDNTIWTSYKGRVAVTKSNDQNSTGRVAARAAIWNIQNPNKIHEAITTAAYDTNLTT